MNRPARGVRALWRRHAALVAVAVVIIQAGMVTGVAARKIDPRRNEAAASTCPLMPIATNATTVAETVPGTAIRDILNGARPGQRGWLTWTGAVGEPVLAASLTLPGDSDTYVNPNDIRDHLVSVGDWVRGRPGVVNSRAVRDALEALIGHEIVVPLWDTTRGQGANATYNVIGFARFLITDYQLPKDNRIGAAISVRATACPRPASPKPSARAPSRPRTPPSRSRSPGSRRSGTT
jgi:hypothetical protein